LQTVLFEAEAAVRASVPPEPAERKAASHRKLDLALYPPKTQTEFPLRWPVVYGAAAALTLMVVSGYLSTSQPPSEAMPQLAVVQSPAVADAEPALREATRRTPEDAQATETRIEPAPILAADLGANATQPARGLDTPEIEAPAPGGDVERVRFELAVPSRLPSDTWQSDSQQLALLEPPSVPVLPANVPAALVPRLPLTTFRTVVEEVGYQEAARLSSPSAFANVIEGYWLLAQARVWEEDLHPVWTSRGLLIEGTVEDAEVRDRVRRAVLRQASETPAFQIQLRKDLQPSQQASPRMGHVVHAAYSGTPGGAVRRSLLSHFSDTARRSFVSPQPSLLEAELVRYVSEVYGSQSDLLSHAYSLHRFLERLNADHLASADQPTTRRFRDLVRFHLAALDEREAVIYDRLSEALPRKVWTHRGDTVESNETLDWREESQGLLQDALELDSNLTALFGSSSLTVDISNPELSCGELLNRIRTRIRRIKNRTQVL
jgi:hypothetical protein